MQKALVMNEADNVATAIAALGAGDRVPVDLGGRRLEVTLVDDIPFGHKFALRPIARGEAVIKYGAAIGLATAEIKAGRHVHSHNLEGARGRGDRA